MHDAAVAWLATAIVTVAAVVLFVLAGRSFGLYSVGFAFAVVWLPMMWLGTASRAVPPRLPARLHALRAWERDGRVYELLGVRGIKALLRRGPFALFNPKLHLPSEPTPERLAALDRHMRIAEASHAYLFVLTLPWAAWAAMHGAFAAAAATVLFDVLVNGYPVMLQRYNRARLARRFGALS